MPSAIISSFRIFLNHGKSHWLCNGLLKYIGSPKAGADRYIQRADSQWTEKQRVIGCGVHYGVSLQFVSAILSSLVIFHTHSSVVKPSRKSIIYLWPQIAGNKTRTEQPLIGDIKAQDDEVQPMVKQDGP